MKANTDEITGIAARAAGFFQLFAASTISAVWNKEYKGDKIFKKVNPKLTVEVPALIALSHLFNSWSYLIIAIPSPAAADPVIPLTNVAEIAHGILIPKNQAAAQNPAASTADVAETVINTVRAILRSVLFFFICSNETSELENADIILVASTLSSIVSG